MLSKSEKRFVGTHWVQEATRAQSLSKMLRSLKINHNDSDGLTIASFRSDQNELNPNTPNALIFVNQVFFGAQMRLSKKVVEERSSYC